MPRTYGKKPSYLKPAKLPQKTLVEIGRIVRAVAEIEDLVDLHICNLAGLSESKATVLLGKTAITRRLEMAKYLAQMLPQEALDIHNAAFGTVEFLDIVECRNAVAHGKLLGKNDE